MKERIREVAEIMKEKREEQKEDRRIRLEELRERCSKEESTLRKLYMIRDSRIKPYRGYATTILKNDGSFVSMTREMINQLANEGLINGYDFEELMARVQEGHEKRQAIKGAEREKRKENRKQFFDSLGGDGLVHCPKCGSTSIVATHKRFSATRMVTLGVAGALSSKKMYNVCQKCGHKWKI